MTLFSKKIQSLQLPVLGGYIIAIGIIVFGIQNFLYTDFIAGRAPSWSTDSSLKLAWTYLSGCVFIITGILLLLKKNPRSFLILCALMVLCWAVFRHIPILAGINFTWSGELTNGGKALTIFVGLLAAAGSLPPERSGVGNKISGIINQQCLYILIGRVGMGIFLIICGYEHFIFLEFVKTLVPSWIPGNIFWSELAGVALIAGGIGLMIPKTAPLAGMLTGIMIFTWFLILHLPRAISVSDQNEWTAVVEAFTFSGIAFVVTQQRSMK